MKIITFNLHIRLDLAEGYCISNLPDVYNKSVLLRDYRDTTKGVHEDEYEELARRLESLFIYRKYPTGWEETRKPKLNELYKLKVISPVYPFGLDNRHDYTVPYGFTRLLTYVPRVRAALTVCVKEIQESSHEYIEHTDLDSDIHSFKFITPYEIEIKLQLMCADAGDFRMEQLYNLGRDRINTKLIESGLVTEEAFGDNSVDNLDGVTLNYIQAPARYTDDINFMTIRTSKIIANEIDKALTHISVNAKQELIDKWTQVVENENVDVSSTHLVVEFKEVDYRNDSRLLLRGTIVDNHVTKFYYIFLHSVKQPLIVDVEIDSDNWSSEFEGGVPEPDMPKINDFEIKVPEPDIPNPRRTILNLINKSLITIFIICSIIAIISVLPK